MRMIKGCPEYNKRMVYVLFRAYRLFLQRLVRVLATASRALVVQILPNMIVAEAADLI